MPGPAAVFAGPGAVAAAKHLAVRVASSPAARAIATSPGVTSFTVLLYYLFQKLPAWVREDISFRNLLKHRKDIAREELESLYGVLEKLRKVAESIQDLDNTDIPQLHAAVLAFVQLSGQNKLQQIEEHRSRIVVGTTSNDDDETTASSSPTVTRDYFYEMAGDPLELSSLRTEEVQTALKMATFAYYEDSETLADKLLNHEYTVLHHKLVDIRPGKVAHYIAVSPTQRKVIIGLRGTSTLGDLLTDCCGHAVPLVDEKDTVRVEIRAEVPNLVLAGSREDTLEVISGHERIVLEDHDDDGDNYARCHEGILISARKVLDEIESVLLPLAECGYRIVLCGHSLGGGTAVLVATLLRSKYPEFFFDTTQLHVYTFGAPPVLDHDSSIAAIGYCTSIVHNADLISRLNITNLAVSLACLKRMQNRLEEHDLSPTGPVTSVAFFQKLAQGTTGTPLMTRLELNETIREAHTRLQLRKPEHLFVPGRVLLVYDPWLGDGTSQQDDDDDDDDDDGSQCISSDNLKCVETTGTSPVFQRLEIDGLRCFTDHLTSSYFEILGMNYEF